MATSATMIAAAVARARREICDQLADARASDPANAVPYQPANGLQERQLARLIDDGIVRESGDGRYWLDAAGLEREAAQRVARIKWGLTLLAGVGVIALVLALAGAVLGS